MLVTFLVRDTRVFRIANGARSAGRSSQKKSFSGLNQASGCFILLRQEFIDRAEQSIDGLLQLTKSH
jgi:hypothetical protein